MAVYTVGQKVSLNGKRVISASLQAIENVIVEVVSYLLPISEPKYIIRIPLNRPIGKVFYTVQSPIEPVTFNKRKDAEMFRKLLSASTSELKSDIVRREITEEGFEPTY